MQPFIDSTLINEIIVVLAEEDSNTFHDEIKYPIVPILADTFVKKAYELKGLGF